MSTQNPGNALSGAYKELYVVTGVDTVDEAQIPIGNLYDDWTLSVDGNEVQIDPSSSEISIRFDTHKQVDAEFTNFYTADEDTLADLGLLDADGYYLFEETWEAARLYVYDVPADQVAGPADAIDLTEMPEFNITMDEEGWPSDSEASFDFTARIGGRPQKRDPATVNA